LRLMYANSKGVAKDEAKVIELYSLTTNQGYERVQFNLRVILSMVMELPKIK
jgi:TPR repeat protein